MESDKVEAKILEDLAEDLEKEIKKADADVAQKTTSLTTFIKSFNNIIIDEGTKKTKEQKQANIRANILKFQTIIEQIKIDNSVLIAANEKLLTPYLKALTLFLFNEDGKTDKTVNTSVIGKFNELYGDATYFKTIFDECFVPVHNHLNPHRQIKQI